MKYTYEFVTSKTTYEYEEKWVKILMEMDQEENKTSDSSFRPSSVEMMSQKGIEIPVLSELENIFSEPSLRECAIALLPEALDTLKPKQKALIQAIFFKGMTQEQYAQLMGVSQQSISKRLTVAIKKLKKFFEKRL